MLALSRKTGESIMIGDDIMITVVEIKDGNARIGIDAPRVLPVHRMEIYRDIQAQGERRARGVISK